MRDVVLGEQLGQLRLDRLERSELVDVESSTASIVPS